MMPAVQTAHLRLSVFRRSQLNRQSLLPRDGRSCRSDLGGSSCAVPSQLCAVSVHEVVSRVEGSFMLPTSPERLDRTVSQGPVNLVGPTQSGEECCRKTISTSVVVAVAFRREWF